MKRLYWVWLCLLLVWGTLSEETTPPSNKASKPVPNCAVQCIHEFAFVQGKCQAENYTSCYCSNTRLQRHVSICVRSSCSIEDQEVASTLGRELCRGYPEESRTGHILRMGVTFFVLAMIFLTLRIFTRYYTTGRLWSDDWAALVSGTCLIGAASIEMYACRMGYGKHLWQIPVGNDIELLKSFYALQNFYIAIQVLSKISLLLMYKRIYPAAKFQLACNVGIIFVALHGVAFSFAVIFQCWPLKAIWDVRVHGKCLNSPAIGYTGAAFSILEDLVILCMPIPQLMHLHVKTAQKMGLILMFSIGSFACIASMIRLKYLNTFKPSSDVTWDNTNLLVWSVLEIEITLICACLPTLRPLFVDLIPKAYNIITRKEKINNRANNRTTIKSDSVLDSGKHNWDQLGLENSLNRELVVTTIEADAWRRPGSSTDNITSGQINLKTETSLV